MSYRACVIALVVLAGCAASPPPPPPEPAAAVAPPAPAAPTAAAAPPAPTAAPEPAASAQASAPPSPCPEGMAFIPAGEYVFGQTSKEKVKVGAFCLDVSEVTTDAYAACVKAGKCDGGYTTVCDPSTAGKEGRGKLPMICVDFPQAEKYCAAQEKRKSSPWPVLT